tara:strand:- start:2537 stop:3289 length:753 start_codon:yes stop_codon:yes gene_type:complete
MKLLLENWRKYLNEELLVPTDINKRVISIYDFDETIARSNTEIRVSDKETGQYYKTITTQQEYDRLVADGNYEFDFSNLEYVTDPTELVPVTNKLRNDVKRGKTQVMILTARAGNSEWEIQMYLDSIGIPADELLIVGCEGCNKGEYVEDLVRSNPTIEVVHFYDDSEKNIRDVEDAKERLIDLDRIRFFTINQVGEDAEIQKRGSALGAKKDRGGPRSKEAKTKLGPFKGQKAMGTLGPGGRIPEGKKK